MNTRTLGECRIGGVFTEAAFTTNLALQRKRSVSLSFSKFARERSLKILPSFLQIHVAAVRQHPQHAAGPQSGVAHDRQGEEAVISGGCFQEEDEINECFIDIFTQLSLLNLVHYLPGFWTNL